MKIKVYTYGILILHYTVSLLKQYLTTRNCSIYVSIHYINTNKDVKFVFLFSSVFVLPGSIFFARACGARLACPARRRTWYQLVVFLVPESSSCPISAVELIISRLIFKRYRLGYNIIIQGDSPE